MGRIKKIGNEYFVEFYARGLKYQQRGGTGRADAEALLKDIEAKIERGETALIVRDVDLDIFLCDFIEQAREEHTPPTVLRYQNTAERFQRFLAEAGTPDLRLSQVTPRVVEQYRLFLTRLSGPRRHKPKPRTVNFAVLLLSDILQYGIKLGYINDDPTLHVRLLDMEKARRPRILSRDEMTRIAQERSLRAQMTEWMAHTGMSRAEMSVLTFGDIDEKNNVIRAGRDGAGGGCGLMRSIPMHPRVREIFSVRKNESRASGPVFGEGPSGIDGALTRNTFAHDLISKGMRLSVLYKLLGFADIAMTVPYLIFRREYLQEAVRI